MSDDRLVDGRRPGFYTIDNELIDIYGERIGVYGIAVYNLLARYAGSGDTSFPSYKTIAKKLGISRPKAIDIVKDLVAQGLIVCSHRVDAAGDNTSNVYTLVDLKGGKPGLPGPDVVNHVNHLVNDINHGSKRGEPQVVNDVYPTKKQSTKKQSTKTRADLGGSRAAPASPSQTQAQPPTVNSFGTKLDDPRISTEDRPSRAQSESYNQPALDPAQPPPRSEYFDPRKLHNGNIAEGAGTTAVEITLEYVPFNANTFSPFVCRTIAERVTDFAKWREVMAQTTLKGFAPHNIADRLTIYSEGWKSRRPDTGKQFGVLREPTNDNRNRSSLDADAEASLRQQLRDKRAAAAARNAQFANQRPITPA